MSEENKEEYGSNLYKMLKEASKKYAIEVTSPSPAPPKPGFYYLARATIPDSELLLELQLHKNQDGTLTLLRSKQRENTSSEFTYGPPLLPKGEE